MSDPARTHAILPLRALGVYGLTSRLSHAWMRARGWSIEIIEPLPRKCVIAVYPHTSNWDFPVGLLTKWAAGLSVKREGLRYAGKQSLFAWPWGWFFRGVGGIPVDRSGNTGFSEQMVQAFARLDTLRFTVAPEGTRSHRDHIRSSFYYVAVAANVPLVLATFDFAQKRVRVTEVFKPTGDVDIDMNTMQRYFESITPPAGLGHTPRNASTWRFAAKNSQ